MASQNYWTRSTRYMLVRYVRLHQRLWLSVVMRLNKRIQADLFMRLGQSLRVTSAQVQNGHGSFEGFLKDEKLFKYLLSDGTWSPHIIDLFTRACKELPAGTFLDLGANIGLITVPMAKRNPHLKVVAVEAEPRAFGLLEKNLASNQVKDEQVIRINQAIYKEGGMVPFELSEDNYGDGRVRKADVTNVQEHLKESTRQTIEVPAQKLDDMLAAYTLPAPFIMKADIQGSEHFLLSGGSETLRRTEFLVIEFWPYGLRRVGADPLEFFDQLVTYFDLGCLDDDAPGRGGWVEAVSLRAQVARFIDQAPSHQGIDLILAKAAFAQRVTF